MSERVIVDAAHGLELLRSVADEIREDIFLRLGDVNHDIQLFDDVLDLSLEFALGVDIEQWHVKLCCIDCALRSIDRASLVRPVP